MIDIWHGPKHTYEDPGITFIDLVLMSLFFRPAAQPESLMSVCLSVRQFVHLLVCLSFRL